MSDSETFDQTGTGTADSESRAIRALIADGAIGDALARAESLSAARPKQPRAHVLVVHAALAAAQPERAAAALEAARKAGLADHRADRLLVDVALALGDCAGAAEAAARLLASGKAVPDFTLFRAQHEALMRLGRVDEALLAIDAARVHLRKPAALLRDEFTARFPGLDAQAALALVESRMFNDGGRPEAAVGLRVWIETFDTLLPGAVALARRAAETWPGHPLVQSLLGDVERLAATRAAATPGHDPAAEARAALERFATVPHPHLDPAETALVAPALLRQVDTARVRRPLIEDNPLATVVVGPHGGSGTTLLFFSGIGGHMPLSVQALDCVVATCDATLVFLRDKSLSLFLNGVGGLGDFDQTVAGLRRILRDIPGHRHLCVMATSGGGIGAANYALALGADRTLLFSPPTNITQAFLESIGDRRGVSIQRRLQRTVPAAMLDLRAHLGHAPNPMRVDLRYAAANPVHKAHAEHLAGVPGVTLYPDPSQNTHAVTANLALSGQFAPIVEDFLTFEDQT
ncbi:MAG: hypothetical protein KDK24_05085 [Pseudooceanicola sp.]|nr:hypothetical protein [Pseudooceanicola sp.]